MPPSLALLLCTALVLFLLRLERQRSHGVSAALWIPTIWLLLIASRPLGSWLGGTGDNESGSSLDRWTLLGLALAAVVVLARRRFNWSRALRRHSWLLVVLAYMLASTLWSDITLIAFRRWMRELIVIAMALLILSEPDPRQALASLYRRIAYVLIPFSVLLVKYYPSLGRQYGRWSGAEMWTGVTIQKNHLGRLCLISIFFLLWALHRRWRERPTASSRSLAWADVFVVLMALFLLRGAHSSTSLVSLVVGFGAFLGLRFFRKLNIMFPLSGLLVCLALVALFGISAPFLEGTNVAHFSSLLGRDSTLTGRTEVWASVLPAMERKPFLGWGFGSFWTDARRVLYDIPTAHNGYLDILLELGAVGLGFYAIWLFSCARQLHRALVQDYDWASLGICFLLMGLLYNTTESALNAFSEHMTTVLLLTTFVVVSSRPNGSKKRRESRSARAGAAAASLATSGVLAGERDASAVKGNVTWA